jgi:hypothetical protein
VGTKKHDRIQTVDNIVETRAGVGPSELVAGWQSILKNLLDRMQPFMQPGRLVTFQSLEPPERVFFEGLVEAIALLPNTVGLYLPPSVRSQMLGESPADHGAAPQPDAGVLVASRVGNFDIIVNALFAYAPFTPAVDVYEKRQLIAGYQYTQIEACRAELTAIIKRHLGGYSAGAPNE